MESQKNFPDFFKSLLELRNLTVDELADATGIPKRYLSALIKGEFEKLPTAPYVRGYLIEAAEVLGVNGEEFWQTYKREVLSQTKIIDRLPFNRFAIRRLSKKKFVFGILLIFVIIYLSFRADELLGIPQIEIISPETNNQIVFAPLIELTGKIANPKDKLIINNEQVFVENDGSFRKEYWLSAGVNTIEFKAKRFLGKEIKVIKTVIFNNN